MVTLNTNVLTISLPVFGQTNWNLMCIGVLFSKACNQDIVLYCVLILVHCSCALFLTMTVVTLEWPDHLWIILPCMCFFFCVAIQNIYGRTTEKTIKIHVQCTLAAAFRSCVTTGRKWTCDLKWKWRLAEKRAHTWLTSIGWSIFVPNQVTQCNVCRKCNTHKNWKYRLGKRTCTVNDQTKCDLAEWSTKALEERCISK